MNDDTTLIDYINYEGHIYIYQRRPGKNGDICLATKDPKKYCNGFYSFSSKDPGSGMAFVVISHNNPNKNRYEN